MPKKMRTTRNLLLMATLLGSALFARAADKEMTIGAQYTLILRDITLECVREFRMRQKILQYRYS